MVFDSTSWTGRPPTMPLDGYGIIRKWSLKSPKQLPLLMVWDEYWVDGDVTYAACKFSTYDLRPSRIFKPYGIIGARVRMVWSKVIDQLKAHCSVCGTRDLYSYPNNLWTKTYCPKCCPEHEFEHERGEGWSCKHCGDSAPLDYYVYDYD